MTIPSERAPSERATSERLSGIITNDVNRLIQCLRGVENERQRDNLGIQYHLGEIQTSFVISLITVTRRFCNLCNLLCGSKIARLEEAPSYLSLNLVEHLIIPPNLPLRPVKRVRSPSR